MVRMGVSTSMKSSAPLLCSARSVPAVPSSPARATASPIDASCQRGRRPSTSVLVSSSSWFHRRVSTRRWWVSQRGLATTMRRQMLPLPQSLAKSARTARTSAAVAERASTAVGTRRPERSLPASARPSPCRTRPFSVNQGRTPSVRISKPSQSSPLLALPRSNPAGGPHLILPRFGKQQSLEEFQVALAVAGICCQDTAETGSRPPLPRVSLDGLNG